MKDPHVEALIYMVESDRPVTYKDATSVEFERPTFRVKLEDERAQFELKEHYATPGEACAVVQPFIEQWEFEEALRIGPGQFALSFDRAVVVDRQPTPGVHSVSADPITWHFESPTPQVTLSKPYPQPPSKDAMDIHDPDVQTMLHRYVGYRQGHEYLPSMAYFCLTMLEYRFAKGKRKKAARHFRVHSDVLNKIGSLTGDTAGKGGRDGRKAVDNVGIPEDLTWEERRWLEQATKHLILQAARVAAETDDDIPTMTLADLPPLSG